MSWNITIRRKADADMRRAWRWYERQYPGLGDEFLQAVGDVLAQLQESPERVAPYHRSLRRLMTERFPYKVFFKTDGNEVVVFRVLHAAQDHGRELG